MSSNGNGENKFTPVFPETCVNGEQYLGDVNYISEEGVMDTDRIIADGRCTESFALGKLVVDEEKRANKWADWIRRLNAIEPWAISFLAGIGAFLAFTNNTSLLPVVLDSWAFGVGFGIIGGFEATKLFAKNRLEKALSQLNECYNSVKPVFKRSASFVRRLLDLSGENELTYSGSYDTGALKGIPLVRVEDHGTVVDSPISVNRDGNENDVREDRVGVVVVSGVAPQSLVLKCLSSYVRSKRLELSDDGSIVEKEEIFKFDPKVQVYVEKCGDPIAHQLLSNPSIEETYLVCDEAAATSALEGARKDAVGRVRMRTHHNPVSGRKK